MRFRGYPVHAMLLNMPDTAPSTTIYFADGSSRVVKPPDEEVSFDNGILTLTVSSRDAYGHLVHERVRYSPSMWKQVADVKQLTYQASELPKVDPT